jgi:OOP family OmpA-OmpF porin
MKQISDLAKALHSSKLGNKEIIIEGHTDSDGSSTYNYELSQRRAQSVISILANQYGVALSRLTPKGFGEDRPVYSNKTRFGKAVNRRVAVAINL